jgi:predicted enzyme related to lactoylglutathione lyase
MPAGKICYLEIPTTDIEISVTFYEKIFAWKIRVRGNGERAFDDAAGAVSGTWVLCRPPSREPGMLTYVMVDNIDGTLDEVSKAGGQVVTPRTALGPGGQAFARFRDQLATYSGYIRSDSHSPVGHPTDGSRVYSCFVPRSERSGRYAGNGNSRLPCRTRLVRPQ